jgi:hypothetical protein
MKPSIEVVKLITEGLGRKMLKMCQFLFGQAGELLCNKKITKRVVWSMRRTE